MSARKSPSPRRVEEPAGKPAARRPKAPFTVWSIGAPDDEIVVFELPQPVLRLPTQLSSAECDIVALLVEGHRNARIAELRGVSPNTVANQLVRIFAKLGVGSRSELIALCVAKD
jgi:DNA-binding CsgD family transcriptional regulator